MAASSVWVATQSEAASLPLDNDELIDKEMDIVSNETASSESMFSPELPLLAELDSNAESTLNTFSHEIPTLEDNLWIWLLYSPVKHSTENNNCWIDLEELLCVQRSSC